MKWFPVGLAVLLVLLFPPPAVAQETGNVEVVWEAVLPTSGAAVGNAVRELRDGDLIVVGYHVSPDSANQGVLARLGAAGEVQWLRNYGGTGDDFLWDVAETEDGGFLLVGFTGPDRGVDVWVVRTDARGAVLWERRYGGTGRDRAWALSPDGTGGWYVAAERTPEGGADPDAWLLRLRADGDTAWTRVLGGPEAQRVFSVATLPRGDAVITGGTGSNDRGAGDNDILVARFTADGHLVWRSVFGGPRYDVGHGVVAAGQGVLVTAYGTPAGNRDGDTDVRLLRLAGDGGVIWDRVVPGRGHERAMMSGRAHGGGWITVGFAVATDVDVRLWGTAMDGSPLWRWTRPAEGLDRGVLISPTSDGGYALTGAFGHGGPQAPLRVLKLRVAAGSS